MIELQQFDIYILDFIQKYFTSPFMDTLMPLITLLANGGILWIILTVLLLFHKKHRSDGITLALALITEVIICNLLLKNLFQRVRPFAFNTAITLLIPQPMDYSFPSGHTAVSFTAATILFHTHRKWGIAAYLLAALIGYSRLYLYVHFPSDVLCGALLGVAIGNAVFYLARAAAHNIFVK